MANSPEKDTIYIDVDDDITSIIDKIRNSDEKIVALVLPKRAAVLQSIVNMKLLKRNADDLKKKVVLITSETSVLPLAGATGLFVAKTLQSAPHVPEPPATPGEIIDADEPEPDDVPLNKAAAVGILAGMPDEDETIEVDNDAEDDSAAAASGAAAGKKAKKNKKLKVPNFDSFRSRLFIIIGGLLAVLLLWIFAYKILPKATITITTDSSSINTSLDFTADSSAKKVDEANHVLPATQKTFTKTDTEKVAATGQKDQGVKATGTMTLTNCINDGQAHTIPAGTGFSSSGLTFVSNQAITLDPALFSGSVCKSASFNQSKSVGVTAAQAGDKYNLTARSYTSSIEGISASGSDMTGGVSKITKVVAQGDIDGAKQKMLDRNNDPAKAELNKQMQADHLYAITDSFTVGTPAVTSTPNVGDEASDVTVNMTVSYTMLGVKQDDLKKLVENEAKKKINQNEQTILSNGLDKAQTQITDKKSDTVMKVSLQTNVEAGPQLDSNAIKKAVAGKKRGDTQSAIEARPGIKEVKIDYNPFYVGATPTRTSRIKVVFLQPNGTPSNQ